MNRSRSMVASAAGAVFLFLAGVPDGAAAGSPRLSGLAPGKFVVQKHRVPVRIVLVGFGDEVDDEDILRVLPDTYKPVVRYPRFYGIEGRNLGLAYDFSYRIVRKSSQFATRFFSYLKGAGTMGPLTAFQQAYNDQMRNVRDVKGPVLYIDAPSVEKWLLENEAGDPGARGYTIYFINWYGRSDFRFHVYTKTDEPDPDTLYNFGTIRDSRKIISWGGTHSRNWFYDFSAGPDAWGGNYDVDDVDLDGDDPDVLDYRVPPIWEYVRHGYRRPEKLGGDMGLLARFVAIDLLFTTSPVYDPFASAPDAGGRKVAHVAMMEDEAGASGLDWYHSDFAEDAWKRFEPYYRWKAGLTDHDPIDGDAKRSLDIFSGALAADDCWNAFGDTFAQLFCYFDANLSRYIPRYGRRDSVGAIFAFNTSSDLGGLLGFADDNWTDGTPTYEFCFDSAPIRELGFGFTTTVIHEFGHHIGMSHPHDGYDSEFDADFDAAGAFFFAWLGDESDTVMQYIALSNGFGRHNQDNMYRWKTAGYLNWANALAGDILDSPRADRVMVSVMKADGLARQATDAFRDWRYLEAAGAARGAYATLKAAADDIGVSSRALAESQRQAALGMAPKKKGCQRRFLTEKVGPALNR